MRRLTRFSGSAGFCPQERKLVGVVLNLLLDADASGVAASRAVVEEDGAAAGGDRLPQHRPFAGVERIDARGAVPGEEHDGGIVRARLDVLVGRVLVKIGKLFLVFGGTILRGPV